MCWRIRLQALGPGTGWVFGTYRVRAPLSVPGRAKADVYQKHIEAERWENTARAIAESMRAECLRALYLCRTAVRMAGVAAQTIHPANVSQPIVIPRRSPPAITVTPFGCERSSQCPRP